MTNEKLIKNIENHQANSHVHPLTCGVDSRHEVLVPKEVNGKVVLVCPTCGYLQDNIPACIYGYMSLDSLQ